MGKFRKNDIVVLTDMFHKDSKPMVGVITHVQVYNDNPAYSVTCYDIRVGEKEFYCIPENVNEFTEAMLDSIMPNGDYEIREATIDDMLTLITSIKEGGSSKGHNGDVCYNVSDANTDSATPMIINVNMYGKMLYIRPDMLIVHNLLRRFVKRIIELGMAESFPQEFIEDYE